MPLIRHSLFLLLVSCGGVAVALPGLIISVTVGDYQIRAELAAPPEQRQRGLMGRAQLA